MGRVFVAGSINMDVVATADRHPKVGETVAGRQVLYFPGGNPESRLGFGDVAQSGPRMRFATPPLVPTLRAIATASLFGAGLRSHSGSSGCG